MRRRAHARDVSSSRVAFGSFRRSSVSITFFGFSNRFWENSELRFELSPLFNLRGQVDTFPESFPCVNTGFFLVFSDRRVSSRPPSSRKVSSMPGARTTNNSVSTLEEQSDLIRSMAEKGNKSSSAKSSVSQEDLTKKKGKKGKRPLDPETRDAAEHAPLDIGAEPVQRAVNHRDGDVTDEAAQAQQPVQMAAPMPMAAMGFPTQQVQPPMPFFFPQMPQQMGYQGMYPQQALGFMNCAQMDCQNESDPEDEPVPLVNFSGRQADHEMSDDDDSVISVATQAQKQDKAVDFSDLKTGKLAALLQSQHQKIKEEDRVTPPINDKLAHIVNGFFEETKAAGDLERLAKEYPQVKNMPKQLVPKLDPELFTALDPQVRAVDVALQNIQKGVVAAISAMAPIGSLMLQRGESDKELDDLSGNMLDSMRLLALTSKGMEHRRREALKPSLQHTYAKVLGKPQEGDPQWLYGGNLSEATRKCEVAKRLADKIVKKKGNPQGGNAQQNRQGGHGQAQNKKFKQGGKQNWQTGQGWQNHQQGQMTPRMFGYQYYQQPQMPQMAYQNMHQQSNTGFRPRGQKPQQQGAGQGGKTAQDFQKRGAQN